jgi:hypothetical protein
MSWVCYSETDKDIQGKTEEKNQQPGFPTHLLVKYGRISSL